MRLAYVTGALRSVGRYYSAGFAPAETAQTITPTNPILAPGASVVFTTNYPASWTATSGTLVVAGDGLSATYTAPGGVGGYTITVTDLADPGNVVATVATVLGSIGEFVLTEGEEGEGVGAGRGFVGFGM